MSSGNQLWKFAVGGFLIGGILLTADVSFSADPADKPAAETSQSQKAPQDKGTTQQLFVPSEKQVSPTSNKAADDKADYYAKADLDAQERMASEAERLAELADAQLSISKVEAVLLALTLFAAGVAAGAAISAARSGKEIVSVTHDSAERQLRAYVFIKDAVRTKRKASDPWVIAIHIKNFGQTPAYRAQLRVRAKIMDPADEAGFAFPLPEKEDAKIDLAPDHEHTTRIDISWLKGAVWDEFKALQKDIFLWGRVDFVDAFGKPRWMCFRFRQPGGYVLNLYNCIEGNETSESTET